MIGEAWAYLSRVAEPPAPGVVALVARLGPVEAAARIRSGRADERVAAETAAGREVWRAEADLAAATAAGARLITPGHPEWPTELFDVCAACGDPTLAPPVALWVRGPARLAECCARAVAVVLTPASNGTHPPITPVLAGRPATGVCPHTQGRRLRRSLTRWVLDRPRRRRDPRGSRREHQLVPCGPSDAAPEPRRARSKGFGRSALSNPPSGMFYGGDLGHPPPSWRQSSQRRGQLVVLVGSTLALEKGDPYGQFTAASRAGEIVRPSCR
jgi:hypothetical protein